MSGPQVPAKPVEEQILGLTAQLLDFLNGRQESIDLKIAALRTASETLVQTNDLDLRMSMRSGIKSNFKRL